MTPTLTRFSRASIKALGSAFPGLAWRRYFRLAERSGLQRSRFLLSFDCDTDRDIEVAWEVHQRLASLGIIPVFAVPGQLLETGAEVYRKIASTGAEFINHGYVRHTEYEASTRSYISTIYYDRMTPEEVRQDIELGHRTVERIIGVRPRGFRVPHFGTYQSPEHLRHLYSVLQEMDYRFSSSTVPTFAFWSGPIYRVSNSLVEIPVTGCRSAPHRILDSWSFRFAPGRNVREEQYSEEFRAILNGLRSSGAKGLFNIYADPSQVHDWPLFYDCVANARDLAVPGFIPLLKEAGFAV